MLHGVDVAGCWGRDIATPGGVASGATIKSHEKGVQPLRRRIAIESSRGSLRQVRTPFGGGNTERIRSRATSCNPFLVSIAISIDRLRVDIESRPI